MNVKVLFVCKNKKNQTPTAQGVFERLVLQMGLTQYIKIDSAGTHDYHEGHAPAPRAQAAAQRRGFVLCVLCVRWVVVVVFVFFVFFLVLVCVFFVFFVLLCLLGFCFLLCFLLVFVLVFVCLVVFVFFFGGLCGFVWVLDLEEMGAEGL